MDRGEHCVIGTIRRAEKAAWTYPRLFLLCGLLLALARFQARPHSKSALACGAIVGLFALTRENAQAFLLAIPIWLLSRFAARALAQQARWLAVFFAGAALVLVPVAPRNQSFGGGFEIPTAQLGSNFYIGDHSGATGLSRTPMASCGGSSGSMDRNRCSAGFARSHVSQGSGRPFRSAPR